MKNCVSAVQGRRLIPTTSRWAGIVLLCLWIAASIGCVGSGGDDDGSDTHTTPTDRWTLTLTYYYYYNSEGLRVREVDDNNINGRIDEGDVTWTYSYDSDGLCTGYLRYDGSDMDADGIGTYFYNDNDCNFRLEEETPEGTDLQVWTYDVDTDCEKNSYRYEGKGTIETGVYSRNPDGYINRLTLGTGEYWVYTLDDFGKRLFYDYYNSSGKLLRYGIYYYNDDDKLVQLDSYTEPTG